MSIFKKADEKEGQILERLSAALKSDGDFPVRAKVVSELRALANNPNTQVDQIADLILREPSLGTRVLHLVNSAYYQRTSEIVTVSQAVMQLGMRTLSDLCAGLVLMQKFVPAAKRGGFFADSVRRSILTALIANNLASESKEEKVAETGYLAGTFYNLGYMLLAYYFPQVYEAAAKRARARGHLVTQSITAILGVTPIALALSLVDALKIPQFYTEVLREAYLPYHQRKDGGVVGQLADVISAAGRMADVIVDGNGIGELEAVLDEISKNTKIKRSLLVAVLKSLPEMFANHCEMIELSFLELPEWLEQYQHEGEVSSSGSMEVVKDDAAQRLTYAVEEIKAAVKSQEPISSVVSQVMEALSFILEFQRVVLLYADSDKTKLMGRMGLGPKLTQDPKKIQRPFDSSTAEGVDVKAFTDGSPQFFGESVLADGFPFVAIPVGIGEKCKGVIYADKVAVPGEEVPPLSEFVTASLTLMTDLLDQSVSSWE